MSSQRSQSPIRQVKLMLGGVAQVPAVAAVCVSFSLSGITERARAPLIARCHPLTAPLHLAGVGPAGAPAALGEAESSTRAVSRPGRTHGRTTHTQRRHHRRTFHLYKSDVRRESHRATCSSSRSQIKKYHVFISWPIQPVGCLIPVAPTVCVSTVYSYVCTLRLSLQTHSILLITIGNQFFYCILNVSLSDPFIN